MFCVVAVNMASSHAQKVQQHEAQLQGRLREKQQAFEAAFSEEIQHYKKFGETQCELLSGRSICLVCCLGVVLTRPLD